MSTEITGRVIDRQTGKGKSGLNIEAWLPDAQLEEPFLAFSTEGDGGFRYVVEAEQLRLFRKHKRSVVSFQVYRGDEHVVISEVPNVANLGDLLSEFSILVDLSSVEAEMRRVTGQVCTPEGLP